jgi:hypothetical protein
MQVEDSSETSTKFYPLHGVACQKTAFLATDVCLQLHVRSYIRTPSGTEMAFKAAALVAEEGEERRTRREE